MGKISIPNLIAKDSMRERKLGYGIRGYSGRIYWYPDWKPTNENRTFKEMWDLASPTLGELQLQGHLDENYVWNENNKLKIEQMNYLEERKASVKREIEHGKARLKVFQEDLEKLEYLIHPTNDELYGLMQTWDILNIGDVYAMTIPDGYLISNEQENIVKDYIKNIKGRNPHYGLSEIKIEIVRVNI